MKNGEYIVLFFILSSSFFISETSKQHETFVETRYYDLPSAGSHGILRKFAGRI